MREIETVMTYEDWEREYFKRSQQATKKFWYYLIQKLMGCILIILSFIAAYVLNDGTICIFSIPLGLYLILTKEKVIYDLYN